MRRFTEISAPLEERLAASALARVADVTLAVLRVRREVGDALENEALTLTLTDAARRALAARHGDLCRARWRVAAARCARRARAHSR